MQYRKFGKLDWQASALGFGCMRLPTLGAYEKIDEPEAIRMLRYAIDNGVNYVDTAYGYHGGNSEGVVGKALQDGYRGKVKLATKLPPWHVNSAADFDRIFDEQLSRLQTDTIDRYLLHSLSADSWHKIRDFGVLEWAERQMAAGRIGVLGFSFHDALPAFREIVDAYDNWAFCQIQYNYLNETEQAGTEGLLYAAGKGLAVVIMEPLLGGNLTRAPQPVQDLWNTAATKRSPAEWALQWLWNKPEVSVVLSGMSTMEQVQQNLASADASGVGTLSPADVALVGQVRDRYSTLCPIPCTACEYCMPCPSGVNIPRNFAIYNQGVMYDRADASRSEYVHDLEASARASQCTQCRQCELKCPQHIEISEWMTYVDEVLGQGKDYVCALP
ncbi:MAG: aldo/keto reductase [Anaerolineae bacterium]